MYNIVCKQAVAFGRKFIQWRSFLSATLPATGCAEVVIVPLLSDNYSYVIIDRISKKAAVVDPGDATPVINVVERLEREKNIELTSVLCTHKHDDHVGGNIALKQHFPNIDVIGTAYEDIPALDCPVHHDDTFLLGSLTVKTLHTPCHTKGHVCFFFSGDENGHHVKNVKHSDPILFSGDTLFAGGCGRFFEGTAQQMYENMKLLRSLPSRTQIYCGHEYTLANISFLLSMKVSLPPEIYESIEAHYDHAVKLRQVNIPTVPSTISDELSYNLFMMCGDSNVQLSLGCPGDAVGTMHRLRDLKNVFK